jgi:hypothetical protein
MYQQGDGVSRDLSERGAFVFAVECPPLGTTVDLKINLQRLEDINGIGPVEFEGRVLRVEHSESGDGFAVERTSLAD